MMNTENTPNHSNDALRGPREVGSKELISVTRPAISTNILNGESADNEERHQLSPKQHDKLLSVLKKRLSRDLKHFHRPRGIDFNDVQKALEASPDCMWSLFQMEETGGEPDIIAVDEGAYIFADSSKETPKARRNCVYDREAQEYLLIHSPNEKVNGNVVEMAKKFGVDIMSEDIYRKIQKSGYASSYFDIKTRSWLKASDSATEDGYGTIGCNVLGSRVFTFDVSTTNHNKYLGWRGMRSVPRVK